jgi:hypothetical protein
LPGACAPPARVKKRALQLICGSFLIDPRVICETAEEDFHLRFHAQGAERAPSENLGVMNFGDVIDILDINFFHFEPPL